MDLGFLAPENTPHCDIEDEHQGLASDLCRSALRFRFEECKRGTTSKNFGGADGIRTHDLLDAIEARSQLRHGPTD